MAQQYDRIIKENIQSVVLELLRKTTDVQLVEYQVIFPELPKTIGREADFVLKVRNPVGEEELVHLEFQSFNDAKMLERMLLYLGLLRYTYRLPVRQFVFYIGEEMLNMETHYRQRNVDFAYEIIDLEALSYREFLESDNQEMVILAILSDFEDKEAHWIVQQIFSRLVALDDNPAELQRHIRQLDVLSVLRKLQQDIIQQEENMALILDIKDDLRYQKLVREHEAEMQKREKEKNEMALEFLRNGLSMELVSEVMKMSRKDLEILLKQNPLGN
jgi:hypothetical protein